MEPVSSQEQAWSKLQHQVKKLGLGFFFSYSTCFLQAKAFKGEWHDLNIYLLYKELIAVASINPKREAQ